MTLPITGIKFRCCLLTESQKQFLFVPSTLICFVDNFLILDGWVSENMTFQLTVTLWIDDHLFRRLWEYYSYDSICTLWNTNVIRCCEGFCRCTHIEMCNLVHLATNIFVNRDLDIYSTVGFTKYILRYNGVM